MKRVIILSKIGKTEALIRIIPPTHIIIFVLLSNAFIWDCHWTPSFAICIQPWIYRTLSSEEKMRAAVRCSLQHGISSSHSQIWQPGNAQMKRLLELYSHDSSCVNVQQIFVTLSWKMFPLILMMQTPEDGFSFVGEIVVYCVTHWPSKLTH